MKQHNKMKWLNDKLLNFAGFEYKTFPLTFGIPKGITGWYIGDKFIRKTKPNLVYYGDAQVLYLYPKLFDVAKFFNYEFDDIDYVFDPNKKQWFCVIGFIDETGHVNFIHKNYKHADKPCISFAYAVNNLINAMELKDGND